ncbi:hypothetical protein KY361_00220 [Candidatus Woesearchaeota archaeon]|nr:hypothetical protein [Candidatus Woesearchaeota archaeon]
MAKLHTRLKRKLRMKINRRRNRAPRPKTFKSEEAAKRYAEAKGIKDYKLVNIRSSSSKRKKLKIVGG